MWKKVFFGVLLGFFGKLGFDIYCAMRDDRGSFVLEDMGLEINQLVQKHGFPFENHSVTTEDGYVLQLHRIPHGRSPSPQSPRPPILLMHGLLESSIFWITNGPEKSLPYILAEAGYDVWLGNARGNHYSRKHVTLNPDTNPREFFNFSWHEIGVFDLPAKIEFILQETGQDQLFYAGHSQGSIAFMVLMSEREEYNEKIRLMLGVAPVIFVNGCVSPGFTVTGFFQRFSEYLVDKLDLHELFPKSDNTLKLANRFCRDGAYLQNFCMFLHSINGGFNTQQFNKTLLPLLFSHIPAGAATKQLLHYTQLIYTDFKKFDYGIERNLEVYGQEAAPVYDLSKVSAPVALIYGKNDWVTSESDVRRLAARLPKVVWLHAVGDENFAHFDFVISLAADKVLYPLVLQILAKF